MLRISLCLMFAFFFHWTEGQFDTGMSEDRRVIVQLFYWPFNDIREECRNVLGPQRFGGVLVSPVQEPILIRTNGQVERPWYEIYQPVSWNIFSRLGTEQEFRQMVDECNRNNVRIYVDVVLNHGVGSGNGEVQGIGGTRANAQTKDYPGLGYTRENFHEQCQIDDSNKTSVRVCELVFLQDVNQTQQYVRNQIVPFLNRLIDSGVTGFRLDAAKHMWPGDLQAIYSQLHDVVLDGGNARIRPFYALEVTDSDGSYQEDYRYVGSEYNFEFNGRVVGAIFLGSTPMSRIYEYAQNPTYLSNTTQDHGSNHDSQREYFPNGYGESPDRSGIQQVINAFILTFSRQTPNILSGFSYTNRDQGPPSDASQNIISPLNCNNGWVCEHRFGPVTWVVRYFTNFVKDEPISSWWSNWDGGSTQQAAFTRGQNGFAVFNADSTALNHVFQVSLPAGVYCDLATGFYSSDQRNCIGGLARTVEVRSDGNVEVHLPALSRAQSGVPEPSYLVISTQSMFPRA